VTVTCDCVESS